MKRLPYIITTLLFLAACQHQVAPNDYEQRMAEMMGITVEDLRNQTPEEHMKMMMGLSKEANEAEEGFLPGRLDDLASLPVLQSSQIVDVNDGDTIDLTPTIVRSTIRGKDVVMYGYNGQVPGPLIRAPQGADITVRVRNDISQPTTVHWHGLRLGNANDGVPGVTQGVINAGESFTYTISVPDEGVYWYHSHVREDIQQDLGLYGNLLVSAENPDAYGPAHR